MIRKAKPDEWKDVKRLNKELFKYECERFDDSCDIRWIDGEDKYYQKAVTNDEYLTLVYEVEGKIVGYVIANCRKRESYRKAGIKIEIENMFIEPDYRGQHIGTRMFAEIEKWAIERKASTLSVTASAANTAAISFYKKQGFGPYNLTLEKPLE